MAFRAAANSVRDGLAIGDFKAPSKDFEGFANALSAGLIRADTAKMQEDLEIRREARLDARRVKSAADAAEKVQKKQTDLANLFMGTQGDSIKNSKKARDQVVALIDAGGITSLSGLQKYMDENATYVEPTTMAIQGANMPANPKLVDLGLGYRRNSSEGLITSFSDTTPMRRSDVEKHAARAAQMDPDTLGTTSQQSLEMAEIFAETGIPIEGTTLGGTLDKETGESMGIVDQGFKFGPKPTRLTNKDVKVDNWQGLLWQATRDQNLEDIDFINGIANASGWVKIMGQNTQEDLIGLELEQVVELKENFAGTLSPENKNTVDAIIKIKESNTENSQWWNTTDGLLKEDTTFLTVAAGIYRPETTAGKLIAEHLRLRIPIENNLAASEIDLSGILEEDAAFYDAYLLTATGDEFNTIEGAAKIQKVLLLKAAAVEKERLGELADEKALTIKVQALNAWYKENGFFVLDGDNTQPIKKPSSGKMAEFENLWTAATTAAKDPNIWESVDKIKSMDVNTLKMVVSAKLLPENSPQMAMVKDALSERTTQEADAASAELRDFTGENFSTAEQMDVWLASRGGADKLFADDDQRDAWIRTKAILVGNELAANNEAKAKEFTTSYAAAFSKFINNPETQKLKGEEFQLAMAEFERNWKDGASATPKADTVVYDNDTITRLIIEAETQIQSGDAAQATLGRTFIDTDLPIILAAKIKVENLSEEAAIKLLMEAAPNLSREDAILIHTNAMVLKDDAISGEPTRVDITNVQGVGALKATDPMVLEATKAINNELSAALATEGMSAEEIAASDRLLSLGHEGLIKELGFDPKAAMGGSGFFGNIANSAASLVGWTPFKDVAKGKDYMNALNNSAARVLSVLMEGTRDSVFKNKQAMTTLPKAARFMTTDYEGMVTIRRVVQNMEEELARLSEIQSRANRNSTPKQKSDAYALSLQLDIIVNGYKAVDLAWQAGTEGVDMSQFKITPTEPLKEVEPAAVEPDVVETAVEPAVEKPFWPVTEAMIKQFPHMIKYRGNKIRVVDGVVEVQGE